METIIERLVRLALEEDLGEVGDVTSQATIPETQQIHARITAKAPGVIAGQLLVEAVYQQVDPQVVVTRRLQDGDIVTPGSSS